MRRGIKLPKESGPASSRMGRDRADWQNALDLLVEHKADNAHHLVDLAMQVHKGVSRSEEGRGVGDSSTSGVCFLAHTKAISKQTIFS